MLDFISEIFLFWVEILTAFKTNVLEHFIGPNFFEMVLTIDWFNLQFTIFDLMLFVLTTLTFAIILRFTIKVIKSIFYLFKNVIGGLI